MDFSEPQHKKIIGIMYIVFSALGLLCIAFYDVFMDAILDLAAQEEPEVMDKMFIFDLIAAFIWGIGLIFYLPRLIIGIGLAQGRRWANTPGLVFGIISLINIPLGTLLGSYAILAFTTKPKEEV